MRRVALTAAIMAGCFCYLPASWAGVYNTAEPIDGPVVDEGKVRPLPFDLFWSHLADQRGVRVDAVPQAAAEKKKEKTAAEKRADYLKKIDTLKAKIQAGPATLEEQINLSAYLIWVNRVEEAIRLLEPLVNEYRDRRDHGLLLANLGTAYEMQGQPERAAAYLQQARDCWPRKWPGLTGEQLKWYEQVERQQLRLLLRRQAERNKHPAGTSRQIESVDHLFGDSDSPLRYLGESGKYEAGKLAPDEQKKLPPDALAIVQQLVLWLPFDDRLYWQVGELLNAQGDISSSYKVLDDCVYNPGRGMRAPELLEHRQVLWEALEKAKEAARRADKPASLLPETPKLLLVGGSAAFVVILLLLLQVREVRRRRQASKSAS